MSDDIPFQITVTHKTKHDLRTPLNQIMGYAELIREELGDEGNVSHAADFQKLQEAAQRLLRDIDALFDVEKPQDEPAEAEADLPLNDTLFGESLPDSGAIVPGDSSLRVPSIRAKVLVVDDSDQNREILTRRLAQYGYAVQGTSEGYAALELLQLGIHDLVLLDINMPGMNGFEVLARIREQYSRTALPVIMTTARARPEDIVEGLRRGANDFVPKPLNIPLLLARMETHLIISRQAQGQ